MSARARTFVPRHGGRTVQLGARRIFITPAVEESDGRPLSVYSAFFGAGEGAELPTPYEEVWVVVSGRLRIESGGQMLAAGTGAFLHVPEGSPGEVHALEDTRLVCVSVPPH